jgi:hypothetical protein
MKTKLWTPPVRDLVLPWQGDIIPGVQGFRDARTGKYYAHVAGGDYGYNDTRDSLINLSGVTFEVIWDDLQFSLMQYNNVVGELMATLTFQTDRIGLREYTPGDMTFERGTEYGRPDRQRVGGFRVRNFPVDKFQLGIGFTRDYLLGATTEEIDATFNEAVRADRRLLLNEIFRVAFRNTNYTFYDDIAGAVTVRALLNGDSEPIPSFEGRTFNAATHTHYHASAGATLALADLQQMRRDLIEHGHDGNRILYIPLNLEDTIRGLAGWADNWAYYHPNESLAPGDLTRVANVGPEYIGVILGFKVRVMGWFPDNYLFAYNGYGQNNRMNPFAWRVKVNPAQQGLQLINQNGADTYPLIDSFFERWFGIGGLTRANGSVMFVTGGGTYVVPTFEAAT